MPWVTVLLLQTWFPMYSMLVSPAAPVGLTDNFARYMLPKVTEIAVQPRERVATQEIEGNATAHDVCCSAPDSHLWAAFGPPPSMRRGKVVTRVWTEANLEVDAQSAAASRPRHTCWKKGAR